MPEAHLADDFYDQPAEQALLAALARPSNGGLPLNRLGDNLFPCEQDTWLQHTALILAGKPATVPDGWSPNGQSPEQLIEKLEDLCHRRAIAEIQEKTASDLRKLEIPAVETIRTARTKFAELDLRASSLREGLLGATECVDAVLDKARSRSEERLRTDCPVMGLRTGLPKLDEALDGLNEGLYLMGGPPGVGKTSLALQIAVAVCHQAPVLYVTFENSPQNLTLKAISARAQVTPKDVSRGLKQDQLQEFVSEAEAWRKRTQKLGFVKGSSQLTLQQVRDHAASLMNQSQQQQCLVVVDYLQMMAKASAELRKMSTVRERVETIGLELIELAKSLGSPVLALTSLSRNKNDYKNPGLDNLKESGDLEYAADVVVFLSDSDKGAAKSSGRAVKLLLAKNRDGENNCEISLNYQPARNTFDEV